MEGKSFPSSEEIRRAASLLRAGKLVAFPTETVYGLAANALDPVAVGRIYAAKGRPSTSPLIVHVASIEMARTLVKTWPDEAEALARCFWPGPLTLVLPKHPRIPDVVTAGIGTVGIRIPDHPVALVLIREAGVPLAAPSANRFKQLSPTTAEHVRQGLGEDVDLILDGGATAVGIESTILSLVDTPPVLLRPGMISREEIEAVIGPISLPSPVVDGPHPAPGMHRRHYSPSTPLYLVRSGDLPAAGRGAYLVISNAGAVGDWISMPADPSAYAAMLYDTLHQLDRSGFDWIAVERPPDAPEWAGILDRLERAAMRE
jgi:L-threonylcarbamoyladenylate synthase